MKNKVRVFLVVGLIAVLFTLCYFLIPYPHKSTAVFVLMYIFTMLAILAQLYPLYLVLFHTSKLESSIYNVGKMKNIKSIIYGIPFLRAGFIYAVSQLIITLIVTVVNCFLFIPVWIIIIIEAILIVIAIINFTIKHTAKETIEEVERESVAQTAYFDGFKADCAAFLAGFRYEPLYDKVKELCELVKYSDPVSSFALVEIEDEISKTFVVLKDLCYSEEYELVDKYLNKLIALVHERNIRCKRSK